MSMNETSNEKLPGLGEKESDLLAAVAGEVRSAKKEQEKFLEGANKNFHYAIEWGESAFDAAAKGYFFGRVEKLLEQGATVDNLYKGCKRDMLVKAQNREASTSFCSNMLERYELVAIARFVEMIEDL